MDSPVSTIVLPVAVVLVAIALVTTVSIVLERRYARRVARSPHVDRVIDALVALSTTAEAEAPAADVVLPSDAPAVESAPTTVSADVVRRIVDPGLAAGPAPYPWRAAGRGVLPFDVLGYDGSMVWTKAESDGLVSLFDLGTDLRALAEEMGVDERVLVEEIARRVYGAVDPVVDPTRVHAGEPWTADEREAIEPIVRCGTCLSDAARRLGRDQLDVVAQLIRDGHRPSATATVR